MGHIKTLWIFGFERWGHLRPAKMWVKDRRCFKPLFWGLWIRIPGRHAQHLSDCAVHNMPAAPNGPCDCGAR